MSKLWKHRFGYARDERFKEEELKRSRRLGLINHCLQKKERFEVDPESDESCQGVLNTKGGISNQEMSSAEGRLSWILYFKGSPEGGGDGRCILRWTPHPTKRNSWWNRKGRRDWEVGRRGGNVRELKLSSIWTFNSLTITGNLKLYRQRFV